MPQEKGNHFELHEKNTLSQQALRDSSCSETTSIVSNKEQCLQD
jgi:hypothetical protein